MNHLNEEELILHYYGEADAPAGAGKHLAECGECAAQFAALSQALASVQVEPVPERGQEYGAQVWQRLQGQVIAREPKPRSAWSAWFGLRQLTLVGAVAALIIAAFLVGRYGPHTDSTQIAASPAQVRERIMFVAVGEHLERSRLVLVELVNAPEGAPASMVNARGWAEDLVESNRLYRQTALQAGDKGLSSVLDDLERVLLDVAHSPDQISAAEFDSMRKRIEAKGILFKLRIVEGQLEQKQQKSMPATNRMQS